MKHKTIEIKEVPENINSKTILTFDQTQKTIAELCAVDGTNVDSLMKSIYEVVKTLSTSRYGIGLAAPQIGINKSFFVTKHSDCYEVFINPTYSAKPGNDEKIYSLEECLSVPRQTIPVLRLGNIIADWLSLVEMPNGEITICPVSKELTDQEAIVFQHETDHLLGKTIVDTGELNRETRRSILKETKRKINERKHKHK